MKKLILFLITLNLTNTCLAVVQIKFLPLNQNALVIIKAELGTDNHTDFTKLYSLMNVPEKETSVGKGKGLKSSDNGFTFTCSLSKQSCQIVITKGANSIINSNDKQLSYELLNENANLFTQLFVLNTEKMMNFISEDAKMQLYIEPNRFIFIAGE